MRERSDLSALRFSRIEPTRQLELIASVSLTLKEGSSHKSQIFNEEFWRWQYEQLPLHETRVYVAELQGRVVGYYHVPLYRIHVEGRSLIAGVVQDVAVDTALRGQGVFRELVGYVSDDLKAAPIDMVYTFPNDKSIHTFEKYGDYRRVLTFQTHVLPVHSRIALDRLGPLKAIGTLADLPFRAMTSRKRRSAVVRHVSFDKEVASLFETYATARHVALERDTDYLMWRFFRRPGAHNLLVSDPDSSVAAMFKVDEVFGGDPWPYGVEENRASLEALVQYQVDQGLIAKPIPIEELFVPTYGLAPEPA